LVNGAAPRLVADDSCSVRLTIFVKARSPETRLIEEPDGTITLHVTAPPAKGKANREIVKWLAKRLGRSSSQVRIVAGFHSNTKLMEILDISQAEVARRLGISLRSASGRSAT
jgi:uncharacterized protein (TIGR00251 family)